MIQPAIFVSGLGRCGSSLAMQVLARGGVPTLGAWPAFECNETMGLPRDADWLLARAPGHALKLPDPHRWTPPRDLPALVIWLDRDLTQQAQSMIKFGETFGAIDVPNRSARRSLVAGLRRDRPRALAALASEDRRRLIIRFEDLIDQPTPTVGAIADFLKVHGGPQLDVARAAAAVVPRASTCFPGMLEAEILDRGRAA